MMYYEYLNDPVLVAGHKNNVRNSRCVSVMSSRDFGRKYYDFCVKYNYFLLILHLFLIFICSILTIFFDTLVIIYLPMSIIAFLNILTGTLGFFHNVVGPKVKAVTVVMIIYLLIPFSIKYVLPRINQYL